MKEELKKAKDADSLINAMKQKFPSSAIDQVVVNVQANREYLPPNGKPQLYMAATLDFPLWLSDGVG